MGLETTDHVLLASVKLQTIGYFHNGTSVKAYRMSSSKRPPSCKEGSLGTPWGLHEVCQKIGAGEPLGTVFEGRASLGLRYWECSEDKQAKNLITTRILRLMGLQEGLNLGGSVDTFERYVYIHGTNHEDRLGKPSSSGCLQMSNDEVSELFDVVPLGSHLYISIDADDASTI